MTKVINSPLECSYNQKVSDKHYCNHPFTTLRYCTWDKEFPFACPLEDNSPIEFIKINHCPIRLDSIIGVSAPFWLKVEVKERKKKITTRNTLGLKANKTDRAYAFNVITDCATFTIVPSDKPFHTSSNTKIKCLMEFDRVQKLLLNLKNEEKDTHSDVDSK